MEKEIFTVIVVLVFGGVDSVETFATEEEANCRILEWANENNSDSLTFETATEALAWFRTNEENVDYVIQLHTTTVKLPENKTNELSFSFSDYDYEETRDLWDNICGQLDVDADDITHIVVEYVKVHAEKDEL